MIAIIWFHGIEFRILFIMVITTLPAFTFQILDAFRSMSKDLFEMTMSFRPRRWTLFRVLIVPTIVPGILTAWKVNLGNAARVVVVAELVGATGGVGYSCCASSSCSTWQAPSPGPCSSCCSCWWCSRRSPPSRPGRCATGRYPSERCEPIGACPRLPDQLPRRHQGVPPPDGGAEFTAVDRLSFDIAKGEIVAVLGKTGCGKSTMFNLLPA